MGSQNTRVLPEFPHFPPVRGVLPVVPDNLQIITNLELLLSGNQKVESDVKRRKVPRDGLDTPCSPLSPIVSLRSVRPASFPLEIAIFRFHPSALLQCTTHL